MYNLGSTTSIPTKGISYEFRRPKDRHPLPELQKETADSNRSVEANKRGYLHWLFYENSLGQESVHQRDCENRQIVERPHADTFQIRKIIEANGAHIGERYVYLSSFLTSSSCFPYAFKKVYVTSTRTLPQLSASSPNARRFQRIAGSIKVPALTTCSRKNLSSFLISISSLSKRCISRFVACFFRLSFRNSFFLKICHVNLIWRYAQVAPINPRIQFFASHDAICCTLNCRAMFRWDFITPLRNRPLRDSENLRQCGTSSDN